MDEACSLCFTSPYLVDGGVYVYDVYDAYLCYLYGFVLEVLDALVGFEGVLIIFRHKRVLAMLKGVYIILRGVLIFLRGMVAIFKCVIRGWRWSSRCLG